MKKRILIGCEKSGVIRRAFAARGWDAWSCDLLPAEDGSENHLQCDIFDAIECFQWNMLIAHPECTYLSSSGLHWNSRDITGQRQIKTDEAVAFAARLLRCAIKKKVIENPVGCLSTRLRKPDQIIQPYEFGDDASKRTCLWLEGVDRLPVVPAMRFPGRKVECPRGSGKIVERWSNQTDGGQNKLPPSPRRKAMRSETYPGIANAMADHWG